MLMILPPELRRQILCSDLSRQDLLALEQCSTQLLREVRQPSAASPWRQVWRDEFSGGTQDAGLFATAPEDFDYRSTCRLIVSLREARRQIEETRSFPLFDTDSNATQPVPLVPRLSLVCREVLADMVAARRCASRTFQQWLSR